MADLRLWGGRNISGRLQVLQLPGRYDFQDLRLTPTQARARLAVIGRQEIAAYHPHDTLPNIDEGFLEKVVEDFDGTLLVQLAVGLVRRASVDHYTRVRIYEALVERCLGPSRAMLLLVPMPNQAPGPRETLLQALVSRNYGANHLIVRRSPDGLTAGSALDQLRESQALVEQYSRELGIKILQEQPSAKENGSPRPGSCIQRETSEILAEAYPPRHQQGVCIWFTGLSGSGKSTTAEILTWLLMERGRRVTVLDGDVVRTHLSRGLGFSKEDRDTNVRRIGFVASELVRIGGVVVCAVVSPYRTARDDVRGMVGVDHFVEVFIDTPLAVCEARDVKGMYARARRGELIGFTGIDDPYEPPDHPEIRLETVNHTPQDNAALILDYLGARGFLRDRKP
jgi:sulfate adenylyltransferase